MFQILLTVLIFSAISKHIVNVQCIQKVLVFQNDSKHSKRDGMLQWCFKTHRYRHKYFKIIFKCIYANTRDQSRHAPNQWETSLQYNDVSHWLGTHLDISWNNSKCIYSNVYHCRHTRFITRTLDIKNCFEMPWYASNSGRLFGRIYSKCEIHVWNILDN